MIIIFDAVPVIIAFLCILMVFIYDAAAIVLKVIMPLCVIMILRSVYANLKRIGDGGLVLRAVTIVIDTIRVVMFYRLFSVYAFAARHSGIGSFIDFVLIVIIGAPIFLVGEMFSILLVDGKTNIIGGTKNYVIWNFLETLVFCLFALWGLHTA